MPPPNKTPLDINPGELNRAINARLADLAYVFVAYKNGDYAQLKAEDLPDPIPSDTPPICTIAYERPPSSPGGESGGPADPCIYYDFGGGWEKICW